MFFLNCPVSLPNDHLARIRVAYAQMRNDSYIAAVINSVLAHNVI